MATTELLLVLSISGSFRTCTPRRGRLRRCSALTGLSARGFTRSTTRSELNYYDYSYAKTRAAETEADSVPNGKVVRGGSRFSGQ